MQEDSIPKTKTKAIYTGFNTGHAQASEDPRGG
jgi:hypothetical protein